MPRGGPREGAGRKSKAEEQQLIEKLGPLETPALDALKKGLTSNESWAVKLFMEYFYGKPTERIQVDGDITNEIIWIRPDED